MFRFASVFITRQYDRQNVISEPTYGTQRQDFAVPGHAAEGRMQVLYEEIPVELAGAEVVHLRKRTYSVEDRGYGPLHPETMISPRVAPQMIGLGLLEAIDEQDILVQADPEDEDGNGISGRPNRVWSAEHERVMLTYVALGQSHCGALWLSAAVDSP